MTLRVRSLAGEEGGRQREEIGTGEANGGGAALRGSAGEVVSSVEDKVIAAGNRSLLLFASFASCVLGCHKIESGVKFRGCYINRFA